MRKVGVIDSTQDVVVCKLNIAARVGRREHEGGAVVETELAQGVLYEVQVLLEESLEVFLTVLDQVHLRADNHEWHAQIGH